MKNIIITGTSRGIGFELVQIFAQKGCNVLALSRNKQPVIDLNLQNVTSFSFDLGKEDDYHKVEDFIKANWQQVDVLINNAGALLNKPFVETSISDFEYVYKTNVFGVAEMTRVVIPFMAKESHVVTVSSMGGVQGSMKFPGLAAYSSSKGAVITLTELLAEEFKETGPSFNVLALGAVQTEMLEEAFPGYIAPTTAKEMADYIADFSLNGQKYYNGKMLQVSNSTP
ncbi:NAD(P)-dependent dehydrogenase (short-subunit alcohol dehydrogenase family) [Mesoflavibacter sabulilitoris]|uniref:Short-chain dehydrogenase n=1 Tax=Mesoflavibacter zeaxanthinifaciens subsp. sabulilitoris TaxID=1520893 RepID=A0A2T1NBH8_9FLAO|nr:SDR family oxidoreductase [Mesoflavibacter zeaxanthinifaciens]MBB3125103.1 NAD(P)-dependent dehydrogenase (short-subunit alcohol dehydrogenase family) [Mesoflavibacter zeaxanthinifaciens subsp. sabulilitoris]PSG89779.1 short-chain dehydrogenase [Mesoflavibacter zeaxanthinifaciens subsp. sabulilitoris]